MFLLSDSSLFNSPGDTEQVERFQKRLVRLLHAHKSGTIIGC